MLTALDAKWSARSPGYRPRTRHLREDGSPKYTNRLFLQTSPYLLQHAHNPVDWHAWGDEAFEAARVSHRPVFLSVGYSTCHWCHVMEEESFEDEEIARYLNEHFVAIKVDREERPDVDGVYMAAVQALTGSGGWPMSVWLTEERKPFFGGTYFSAKSFLKMLKTITAKVSESPAEIRTSADELTAALREHLTPGPEDDTPPSTEPLAAALKIYEERFDPVNGGTKGAPKFPSSMPVRFLIRERERSAQATAMATLTLEKIARGGMHDAVGGGFHRYSTDAAWRIPHFEKMLYDNALLTVAFLEAYQATGREDFAAVARETSAYVAREMTSSDGAFYSATDADSLDRDGKRQEGIFFTWTPGEIEVAVGAARAPAVEAAFGITSTGNLAGRTVLTLPSLPVLPPVQKTIDEARPLLFAARALRPPPLRDEKILASWNGLMITAFARAAFILKDDAALLQAERAAAFVLAKMKTGAVLHRSFKDGAATNEACLDDYAFLVAGLLDLYEAGGDARWLGEAIALQATLDAQFRDAKNGGYFLTGDGHAPLLAREKPGYDGAEPSGNSVAAESLLRLFAWTNDAGYLARADATFAAFGHTLKSAPTSLSEMLLALDRRTSTVKEIIVVTPHGRAEAEPFLAVLRRTFLPNHVLTVVSTGPAQESLAKLVPALEGKGTQGGRATVFVCEHQTCQLPTTDPGVFAGQLKSAPIR